MQFHKLVDLKYFGEGNSKGRVLSSILNIVLSAAYDCLMEKPIMTRDILEDEFEKLVIQAKNGKYLPYKETTLQHSDFETFERLITHAFGIR